MASPPSSNELAATVEIMSPQGQGRPLAEAGSRYAIQGDGWLVADQKDSKQVCLCWMLHSWLHPICLLRSRCCRHALRTMARPNCAKPACGRSVLADLWLSALTDPCVQARVSVSERRPAMLQQFALAADNAEPSETIQFRVEPGLPFLVLSACASALRLAHCHDPHMCAD